MLRAQYQRGQNQSGKLRRIGHARRDEADRRKREEVGDRQLQHAGVLLLVEVEVQITAAGHDARVDRQADALRRLECEVGVHHAEVAGVIGGEAQTDFGADLLDRRGEGT